MSHLPVAFHEPYYLDYAREDLTALYGEARLEVEATEVIFFSRVMVARKG